MRVWWLGSLLVAALASAVACTTTTVAPPSLGVDVERTMAASGAFAWSGTRRLVWADYRAAPPTNGGDEGARTAYSLFYGVRCKGQVFEFRAVAAFLPTESWVEPGVLRDPRLTARTLQHEQTHFDLTEVYARKMREFFATLGEPCRRTDADLDGLAQQYIAGERDEQARYDTETGHGLIAARQTTWNADVAGRLTASRAFIR